MPGQKCVRPAGARNIELTVIARNAEDGPAPQPRVIQRFQYIAQAPVKRLIGRPDTLVEHAQRMPLRVDDRPVRDHHIRLVQIDHLLAGAGGELVPIIVMGKLPRALAPLVEPAGINAGRAGPDKLVLRVGIRAVRAAHARAYNHPVRVRAPDQRPEHERCGRAQLRRALLRKGGDLYVRRVVKPGRRRFGIGPEPLVVHNAVFSRPAARLDRGMDRMRQGRICSQIALYDRRLSQHTAEIRQCFHDFQVFRNKGVDGNDQKLFLHCLTSAEDFICFAHSTR